MTLEFDEIINNNNNPIQGVTRVPVPLPRNEAGSGLLR